MSQSVKGVHEIMSLPKAPQVLSRNEKVSPGIPKINSSSNVELFLTVYSWACFLNFGSLQPFLDLKDILLIFPLRQQQAFTHSFIYTTYP